MPPRARQRIEQRGDEDKEGQQRRVVRNTPAWLIHPGTVLGAGDCLFYRRDAFPEADHPVICRMRKTRFSNFSCDIYNEMRVRNVSHRQNDLHGNIDAPA